MVVLILLLLSVAYLHFYGFPDFLKQLLSDPDVGQHFEPGELEKLCSLDFHFKEIEARFAKLGI